jgi:hypothetical protein
MSFSAFWRQQKQHFNTPGLMLFNFSNPVESVELEILQVGEKLNEQ